MRLQRIEFRLAALAILLAAPAATAASFEVTEVAAGVYVAIRPGTLEHPVEGNVTFLVGREDVFVIDTSRTPASAREVIAAIRGVTALPVRTIINTHWHGDHHHGNATYLEAYPGATFVSHHQTRDAIATDGARSLEGQIQTFSRRSALEEALASGELNGRPLDPSQIHRIRQLLSVPESYLEELESVRLTLPTLTFDGELRLHQGDREIRVLASGAGNTRGDAVVYLPAEKVVVTGDLLVSTIPFMSESYPHAWLARLDAIAGLDFEVIVPGHGPLQRDRAWLERHRELLRSAIEQVDRLVVEGVSLDATRQRVDLTAFRDAYAGGDSFLAQEFDFRVGTTTPRHAYLEATSARASALAESVEAEASRLLQGMPDAWTSPEFLAEVLTTAGERLEGVASKTGSGRVYLALDELSRYQDGVTAAAFVVENREAVTDIGRLESLWQSLGPELEGAVDSLAQAFEGKSAAVRAAGEIALNRILTHYHASRSYARAGQGGGGVFYLGTAKASAEWARFCASLTDEPYGTGPKLDGLTGIAEDLSRLALDAYGRGDAALEEHANFIALDAALKQARELLADGRSHGAAASLLEARLRLGLLTAPAEATPELFDERLHRKLFDPNRDHSLARTFWERALEAAGSGDEERLRVAAVIVSEVLPFYFELLNGGAL